MTPRTQLDAIDAQSKKLEIKVLSRACTFATAKRERWKGGTAQELRALLEACDEYEKCEDAWLAELARCRAEDKAEAQALSAMLNEGGAVRFNDDWRVEVSRV